MRRISETFVFRCLIVLFKLFMDMLELLRKKSDNNSSTLLKSSHYFWTLTYGETWYPYSTPQTQTVCLSETMVCTYMFKWRYSPEDYSDSVTSMRNSILTWFCFLYFSDLCNAACFAVWPSGSVAISPCLGWVTPDVVNILRTDDISRSVDCLLGCYSV